MKAVSHWRTSGCLDAPVVSMVTVDRLMMLWIQVTDGDVMTLSSSRPNTSADVSTTSCYSTHNYSTAGSYTYNYHSLTLSVCVRECVSWYFYRQMNVALAAQILITYRASAPDAIYTYMCFYSHYSVSQKIPPPLIYF